MGNLADKVLEDRRLRNAIRRDFDMCLATVKQDLEARGVGGRIADKVGQEAALAIENAKSVAGDNKAVIAGTIATLAVWFLRNPLISWLDSLLSEDNDPEGNDENDRE